jgi:microcystin degradation protein MlrC
MLHPELCHAIIQDGADMTNILLAGLMHETHCFIEERTGIDGFVIHRGQALLDRRGDGSQVDGFLTVAARQGWKVIPTIAYTGGATGLVEHSVFEAFWKELQPQLNAAIAGGLDAVFLSLHGAMVTTESGDPDGELLARIRATPGAEKLPIFGVYDLHATLTPKMGALSDGLVSYRECPHIDSYDSAVRAAELLDRCLKTGVRPKQYNRVSQVVWPPTGTGTRDGGMHALEAAARRMENEIPGVLAVNIVGGYAYADTHDAGVSFGIITEGDEQTARAALNKLSDIAWDVRKEGIPFEHDLDTIVRNFAPSNSGPVLIVEPADNIGGGAPGDCTEVMRALLKYDVSGAGIIMVDPAAVKAVQSVPIGGRTTLSIGGKGWRLDPGPVTLDVELISRSDGVFELEDRNSHIAGWLGTRLDIMGPSAVVRHRGLTILLTSAKLPPFDLGQWRSQGITPEDLKIIGVKAAVGHRSTYEPIASASFTVSTGGPCTANLSRLPYKHLRRPVFPLDL